MAAALASKSPADFRHRAAALASPAQLEKLAADFDYFERRLQPWWIATGQPIVKEYLPGIERRFRASGISVLATEMSGFLETRPDARDYYLHAVPSPEFDGDKATGTALLNHFSAEMIRRMKPDDAGWVAVHEFTHSLYEQAPQDRKDALMRQFVQSGDASALPFYMYLNEAMATATQLLLLERNGRTLDDPYTDTDIPRLGKAVLPLLRTALKERKTLYGGFTAPYLVAGRAALGAEADDIHFRFSCVALLGEDDIRNAFLEHQPVQPVHYFVTTKQDWSRFARLDGILMVRYDAIHFDTDDTEITALMKRHRGFVYIRPNGEHRDVFMLGRDKPALQAARGRMLMDGLDAATAAFEVGYESASQFNREYSRFFGQPPMRDVRTLRPVAD